MDLGAKEVYAACTHGVLSGPAIDRINQSPIKELVMLDTIAWPNRDDLEKFTALSVAPLFAEAIKRISEDVPLSKLFD